MQDVPAGEDAVHVRHQGRIDDGTVRGRVELDAGFLGQFVLRHQSDGKEHGIAVDAEGLFRYEGPVLHRRHFYPFHPITAENVGRLAGKVEGNAEVVQALDNVAGEAGGVGHDFDHSLHLASDPAHAPGHDEPDVARADHDDFLAGNVAFDIDEALG